MDAIILSGGQALRMGGVTKAFLRLGVETFLERIVRTLAPLVDSIILATNAPGLYAQVTGVRVVADDRQGRGPLMGLYAGLSASRSELAFVTTADTPLLQPALVRYLLDHAIDCDALVPCWEKGAEPLCAVYARRCLQAIERVIDLGRVVSFYPAVRVRLVPQSVVRGVDPDGASFFNVNTPEDYERLCREYPPPAAT